MSSAEAGPETAVAAGAHADKPDRFGFLEAEDGSDTVCRSRPLTKDEVWLENSRLKKWRNMLEHWSSWLGSARLKSRVRKGIPTACRPQVWMKLCGSDLLLRDHPGLYASLSKRLIPATDLAYIDRDLSRTYPKHRQFIGHDSPGQLSLRRVLSAYTSYDPDVGYCQGMGFLAGALLIHLPEESAFWTLVAIMHRGRLRELFLPALPRLQESLWILTKLIDKHLPDLGAYFRTQGLHPSMFASQWLLTLYSYCFPFDRVTRIFDAFLHDGHITEGKIVFRVALAVLRMVRPEMLKLAFDEVLPMLRKVPRRLGASADAFMQSVFAERVTTADIRALREEYRETAEGKAVREASEVGVRRRRARSGDMVSPLRTPRGQAMKASLKKGKARTAGVGAPQGGGAMAAGLPSRLAGSGAVADSGMSASAPAATGAIGLGRNAAAGRTIAGAVDGTDGERERGRAGEGTPRAAAAGVSLPHASPALALDRRGRSRSGDRVAGQQGMSSASGAGISSSAIGFFPTGAAGTGDMGPVAVGGASDGVASGRSLSGLGSGVRERRGSGAGLRQDGASSGLNTPSHGYSLPPRLPRLSGHAGALSDAEAGGQAGVAGGAGFPDQSPRSLDTIIGGLGLEYRDGGGLQRLGSGSEGGLLRLGSASRAGSGRSVAESADTSILGGDDATTECGTPTRHLHFNIGSSPRVFEDDDAVRGGRSERSALAVGYMASGSPGARTSLSAGAVGRSRRALAQHGSSLGSVPEDSGLLAVRDVGMGGLLPAAGSLPSTVLVSDSGSSGPRREAGIPHAAGGRAAASVSAHATGMGAGAGHVAFTVTSSVASAAGLSTVSGRRGHGAGALGQRYIGGHSDSDNPVGGRSGDVVGPHHRRSETAPSASLSGNSGTSAGVGSNWRAAGGRAEAFASDAGSDRRTGRPADTQADDRPRRASDSPSERSRMGVRLGATGVQVLASAGLVGAGDALGTNAGAGNSAPAQGARIQHTGGKIPDAPGDTAALPAAASGGGGGGGTSSVGTPATPASPVSSLASASGSAAARLRGMTAASCSVASDGDDGQGDDGMVDDDAAFAAALGQLGLAE